MTQYTDLAAYSTALQFKDGVDRIIVCEGESDRKIIERIINEAKELGRCGKSNVTVDSIQSMVANKGGKGNKQAIMHTFSISTAPLSTIYGLVDREFSDFNLKLLEDNFRKYKIASNIYITRGHSIENYFFEYSVLRRTMIDVFSGVLPHASIIKCVNSTLGIMQWLAALSIYFSLRNLISRTRENFFSTEAWIYDDGSGKIEPDFAYLTRKLVEKHASPAAIYRLEKYVRAKHSRIVLIDPKITKWIIHGHIGHDGIFSAYGAISKSLGLSPRVSDSISKGHIETKGRMLTSSWIRECGGYSKSHPLLLMTIRSAS